MKFSTTLFNTLQKAKLITVAGYATQSFEFDRVTNTVEMALANEEDVTFLDQKVVVDEFGAFTAMNSEGVHNAFKAEMTRPFAPADAVTNDSGFDVQAALTMALGDMAQSWMLANSTPPSACQYSVDDENWLDIPNGVRFNFKGVGETDAESQDLHLTVSAEGVILDLVGEDSGDVHSTACVDIETLAALAVEPAPEAPSLDYWSDDAVQFPRLLTEINATQDSLDVIAIAQAMDLTESDVQELFDRADTAWETHKEREL